MTPEEYQAAGCRGSGQKFVFAGGSQSSGIDVPNLRAGQVCSDKTIRAALALCDKCPVHRPCYDTFIDEMSEYFYRWQIRAGRVWWLDEDVQAERFPTEEP